MPCANCLLFVIEEIPTRFPQNPTQKTQAAECCEFAGSELWGEVYEKVSKNAKQISTRQYMLLYIQRKYRGDRTTNWGCGKSAFRQLGRQM